MVQSFSLESLRHQFRAVTAGATRERKKQAAEPAQHHTRDAQHGENAEIHTARLRRTGSPVANGASQRQARRQTHCGDRCHHYQFPCSTKGVHRFISSPSNS
jgi:hypothetical protein